MLDTKEITLTKSQQQALDELIKFLESNQQLFRLTGYAGTGKSFLMAQFMKLLDKRKLSFIAASPTNKAAKNLERICIENGITSEVTTVAKILGQQPELNQSTGKEEFITNEPSIAEYDIVILDEFSMINEKNFDDIVCELYKNKKTKVVFVGDSAQLPPVKEKESVIATSGYIKMEASLREVVRYDGDIARVAESIRNEPMFNRVVYPFNTTDDKTISCASRQEWLSYASEAFKTNDYRENPDYVRFLVWRNKTAKNLNGYVRSQLWGEDCPDYVIGDRLIAKTPVFRANPNSKSKKDEWNIIINSSEEVEVIGTPISEKDKTYSWQFWNIPVITSDGLQTMIRVLTDESDKDRQELLSNCFKTRKFRLYHYYRKLYDNMSYSYALTTHKSQGSSIDYVFLDIEDMRHCPDLQKILYTALTRAKKQAWIPKSVNEALVG